MTMVMLLLLHSTSTPGAETKIFFLEMGKNKLEIYSPTLSLYDGRELFILLFNLSWHGLMS